MRDPTDDEILRGITMGPLNDEDKDHLIAEQIKAGPWGLTTSQADELRHKATLPGMYPSSFDDLSPNKIVAIGDDPVCWVEHISPHSVRYEFQNIPNEQTIHIILEVLPKALELYLKKSRDYSGNIMETAPGGDLGVKACIPDIWRKMGKLRLAIWDGQTLCEEQPEEILMDMLGHILITLDKYQRENR